MEGNPSPKKGDISLEENEIFEEHYIVPEGEGTTGEGTGEFELVHEGNSRGEEVEMLNEESLHYNNSQDVEQALQKLQDTSNTKYIICDPEDSLETYKLVWTRGLTRILIEEYRKMAKDFRDPNKKQKDCWIKLARNMCQRGYEVTWDMCDRKWRNLKQTFKAIHHKRHNSVVCKTRWEFYNEVEEFFDPIMEPLTRRRSKPNVQSILKPKVSYAHVLDVPNAQNSIVTYPQMVVCDENGFTTGTSNSYYLTTATSKEEGASKANTSGVSDNPPVWFQGFMEEFRSDEMQRLQAIKEMHSEVIQVEKRKCVALEALLNKLSQ